jgi:methyl-accepting chemotaxis protein
LVAEVASASTEQRQGVEQIANAVNQMDKVTQSNAANAQETAGASQELNAQAICLNDVVGQLLALVGGRTGLEASAAPATAAPKGPLLRPQLSPSGRLARTGPRPAIA